MGSNRQPELKHTALPWTLGKGIKTIREAKVSGWQGFVATVRSTHGKRPEAEEIANAEFVVRACNAHEDLLEIVKILKEYVDAGEPLIYFGKLSPHSDDVTLGDMVVAAMKKVEG
mgnify:CR=1 FL=1